MVTAKLPPDSAGLPLLEHQQVGVPMYTCTCIWSAKLVFTFFH